MTNGARAFALFMASTAGRLLRVVAGAALIAWGWTMHGTTTGIILIVIGAVALLAGTFNVCTIAPIIGAPFFGKDVLRDSGDAGPKP